MTIQRMPGSAITPGTITITQLESNVATVVSTGGGPKITNIQVTDNAYTALDDTAVDITGGYITITGTGFVTGCSVIVGQLPAASVTFISSTEVRAQLSAQSAGTYIVYLVNPDGGVGIRVNGVTHSASPAWQTASGLPDQYDGVAINLSLVATDATSYTITSGSLPPGLSLNGNTGVISGTVSGVANDTLYTFTVRATDAQLQDSPRTFTVTITVSDPYFKLTTLLLSGSAVSANTVVRDSSTNNFNLTVYGDARASNFTPYGGAWSNYFSTGKLTVAQNAAFNFGTGNFTIECWINVPNTTVQFGKSIVDKYYWSGVDNGWLLTCQRNSAPVSNLAFFMVESGGAAVISLSYNGTFTTGIWHHVAVTRSGTTAALYFNGNIVASQSSVTGNDNYSSALYVGSNSGTNATNSFDGYISNLRIIKGQALFTGNFSPANSALSVSSVVHTGANVAASITGNVVLLTSQDNRLLDNSPNSFIFTKTNTVNVTSYNPFNITNTGTDGSMYFDGTGDYCTASGNAAFALGTGDFCLETWIYPNSISTGTFDRIVATSDYNGTGFDWTLNTASSALYVAGTAYSISNLVVKSWNHLVYTRSSGVLRGFLNGNLAVYNASATGNVTSTGELRIGTGYSGTAYNGYISNLRIVKGSVPAAYQTSSTTINATVFSPPTTLLTAVTGTSLLTLQYDQPHNNHTFLDSSSNQFVVTRNGNATQGTFSPFSQSGWSNYFPSTAYLNIGTTAAFSFGTGDFTAEGWIYTNSTTVCMFDARSAGSATPWVLNAGSGSSTYYYDGTSYTSSIGITLGQWNHVAAARQSGVLRIFVNGQQGYSASHTVNQDRTAGIRIGDVVQTGQNWTGYLSNLRIVKGQALYTGSFTPPTTVLATNSVGTTGANVAVSITSPVSLLTAQSNRFIDNSSNNFAITATNSPQVQAFSPFAPTAVYNPVSHGGSVYLDGTGDYLNTGSDVGLNLGVGNFTWEFWTYLTVSPADGNVLFQPRTPAGIDAVLFGYKSGSNFTIYATTDGGGSWNLFSNTVIIAVADVLNRWAHWAFTRNGNTYTVYVDGVSKVTGTSANQISQATNVFTLGATVSGYFSGFRFVKAQALSTGNFTPPTAPLTANTIGWTGANVATSLTGTVNFLLNFTDAAILDSTGRNVVESLGDIKSSSVITKFTGASFVSDGSGDYLLTAPTADLEFGSGDFTIELWWYPTSTTRQGIYHGSFGADWCVGIDYSSVSTNQKVGIWASSNGSSWNLINADAGGNGIGTTSLTQNAWNHIAYVRNGTTWMLFVNGNRDLNLTGISGSIVNRATYRKAIGAWYSSGAMTQATGYLTDLRITRYARYTTNFTAPTVPARLK